MKKLPFAIIVIALLARPLSAQEMAPQPAGDPPPLMKILELTTMMDRTEWGLGVQFNKPEELKSPEQVIADLDAFAAKKGGSPQEAGQVAAVAKYRDPLGKLFGSLKLVGTKLGQFVYMKSSVPVWFTAGREGGLTVVVTGITSTVAYNTLRMTARERAAEATRSMILPSLKAFAPFAAASDVKFYGMSVVYGSQNFADKSVLSTKAETVSVVVPAALCQKFITGELTEDELLAAADIYVADRDMVTGVKKIKIILQ